MLIRRDENDIDKVFRQRLHDAQDTPPTELWEGIRRKTSRSRGVAFWKMAALIMLVGLGYTLYHHSGTGTPEMVAEASHGDMYTVLTTDNDGAQEGISQERELGETLPGQVGQSAPPISPDKEARANQPSSSIHINEHQDAGVTPPQTKKAFVPRSALSTTENPVGTGMVLSHPDLTTSGTTGIDPAYNNPVSSAQKELSSPVFPGISSRAEPLAPRPGRLESHLPDAPLRVQQPSDSVWSVISPPGCNCLANKKFTAGLYSSVFQPSRKYYSPLELPSSNVQGSDSLPSKIDMKPGHTFGLSAQYHLSPCFYLATGLEYASFREKIYWNSAYLEPAVQYYTYVDTTYEQDQEGNVFQVINDVSIPIDTAYSGRERTKTLTNTYTSMNVPLLVGFSWNRGRFNLNAEVGPVFRVVRKYSGAMKYDDVLTEVSEGEGIVILEARPQVIYGASTPANEYYSNWKLDLHIGLRGTYCLTPQWSAGLGVQFRQMITPVGNIDRHRILMPGVTAGLYYSF